MRTKSLIAAVAATCLLALGAGSANAGVGFRDRAYLPQPGTCADFAQDSMNQFMYAGTNTPIKWSGAIRSCSSTGSETVHIHLEQSFDIDPIAVGCAVPAIDSAPVTLKAGGDIKGLSVQAPEPSCVGYYFFRVTVVDENGVNVAPNGGSTTFTVHVAQK